MNVPQIKKPKEEDYSSDDGYDFEDIVEEKPSNKIVREYLQEQINFINEEDDELSLIQKNKKNIR